MPSATLSEVPATQLTFPWVLPRGSQVVEIADDVADAPQVTHVRCPQPVSDLLDSRLSAQTVAKQARFVARDGHSRLGKTFRVGSVMLRLLKSYGITDEEIAEGIASYQAKHG